MKITFSFGKNWLRYVKYILNEDICDSAKQSIIKFIPQKEFQNSVFVDIGSGSGLFSLQALRLGAKRVISFDIDENSVKATELCREKFGENSPKWDIFQGSILDESFLAMLKKRLKNEKIILYSWGVLHHTTDLNLAMRNAASLLNTSSKSPKSRANMAYIAIYNKTDASLFWLKIKKFYNKTNLINKFLMVGIYTVFLTFEDLRKGFGLNMRDKARGMHKITDIIDWLGGLPYEPADTENIIKFWENLGFKCTAFSPTSYYKPLYPEKFLYKYFVYLKQVGLGCNEFLFKLKNV